jgi:hypothetical protein
MMNSGQYPGMRYSTQYPGGDYGPPHMSHVTHHPIHLQQHQQQQPLPIALAQATNPSATPSNVNTPQPTEDPSSVMPTRSVSEDGSPQQSHVHSESVDDLVDSGLDTSSHLQQSVAVVTPQHPPQFQQQQRQPPPQQMNHPQQNMPIQQHMFYPGAYYNPAAPMGMYPPHQVPPQHQGGGPQQQQYLPAPMQRQIYGVGPGMQGGGIPPNVIRGPHQAYYTGPVPYAGPSGVVYGVSEDEINSNMNAYGRGNGGRGGRGGRNSGGRNSGRGSNMNMNIGGRAGGGRTGGGRGRYNHQYSGGSSNFSDSGRETPLENTHQQPQFAAFKDQNDTPSLIDNVVDGASTEKNEMSISSHPNESAAITATSTAPTIDSTMTSTATSST